MSISTSGDLTGAGSVTLSNKNSIDNFVQCAISGTYTVVTFVLEATIDGTNWCAIAANANADWSPANGTISPTDNAELIYTAYAAGYASVRARATAVGTGTATFTLTSSFIPGLPIPATTNISTYGALTATSLAATGAITSSSPTAKIGYATGAGGAQTQATDKSTTVVSNTVTTAITLNAASLAAATIVAFTFTNSAIAATDEVVVTHQSAGTSAAYTFNAFPAAGSAIISVRNNTAGALAEAIVIRVTVRKAVSA